MTDTTQELSAQQMAERRGKKVAGTKKGGKPEKATNEQDPFGQVHRQRHDTPYDRTDPDANDPLYKDGVTEGADPEGVDAEDTATEMHNVPSRKMGKVRDAVKKVIKSGKDKD